MESKKNNFMGDIYTSYGPFVGKVCENTNTQLCKDNIIESITSSITENSINNSVPEPNPLQVQIPVQVPVPDNIFKQPDYKIDNTIKKVKIIKQSNNNHNDNHISIKKFGGEKTEDFNNDNEDETTSFFNYKVSIFNFKISIWILILILLILICIGYFIYKYWYLKNTNIITYKKNTLIESKNKTGTNKNVTSDNSTENSTENSTSISSSSSSNSSKNT